MSKKDILEWFLANNEAMSKERIVFILLLAFCLSMVIFITYKITYRGVKYSARFNTGNIIIMMITTVVMMMISTNIAISLGMVGALSIVRFRTAIKDPHDTLYIFWSMVEGLCVGAQMNRLAIISTIVIAVLLILFSFYSGVCGKYIIVVRGEAGLDKTTVLDTVAKDFPKYKLSSSNTKETSCEMIIEISVAKKLDGAKIDALMDIKGVKSVNWIVEA